MTDSVRSGEVQIHRRILAGFYKCFKKSQLALAPRMTGYITLTGLVLFIFATQAFGQGCSQCLDSTRATPPAVQAAYRHAIILLGGFGASFFIVGAMLLRKVR